MTKAEATKRLNKLVHNLKDQQERARRKRSWRPSEIAMCVADIQEDVRAVQLALHALAVTEIKEATL